MSQSSTHTFILANTIYTCLSSAGLFKRGMVGIGIGALQLFRGVEIVICFVGGSAVSLNSTYQMLDF